MMKKLIVLLTLFCLGGCSSNVAIREEFERSTKNYNKMLRWREVENAGMTYLNKPLREGFLASASSIKKREVTITDYRILTTECDPEKGSGEAIVDFEYYILPSNRVKSLTYRQKWSYIEDQGRKTWKVTTPLPLFE